MKLPGVKDLSIVNKKVLLRTNYDVPLTVDGRVADETRIEESLPNINYLLAQKAKIIIITHLDRPGGKPVPGLSLKPVVERLTVMLDKTKIEFSGQILGGETKKMVAELKSKEILLLENLRFDPREEGNNEGFAKSLAGLGDFYINDAFAVSHRQHASIVSLPAFLPAAFGLDFLKEIKVLSKVRENPKRPVVIILGGIKRSKIKAAKRLINWADYILVGGKLVEYDGIPALLDHPKILGSLNKVGEDITMETVEKFKKIISRVKTVVWSGPLGACQDEKTCQGTRLVAEALLRSGAYTVVGGGDTEAILTQFGLVDKINYLSSGGGAMLEFLAEGTLPGIEAIERKS